jgi:hypothetical protein
MAAMGWRALTESTALPARLDVLDNRAGKDGMAVMVERAGTVATAVVSRSSFLRTGRTSRSW